MHLQMGIIVVIVFEELVAVHTVAESDVKLSNDVVLTSKRPAWYCSVEADILSGAASRFFRGPRPASAGSWIGVASMAISCRSVLFLSPGYTF